MIKHGLNMALHYLKSIRGLILSNLWIQPRQKGKTRERCSDSQSLIRPCQSITVSHHCHQLILEAEDKNNSKGTKMSWQQLITAQIRITEAFSSIFSDKCFIYLNFLWCPCTLCFMPNSIFVQRNVCFVSPAFSSTISRMFFIFKEYEWGQRLRRRCVQLEETLSQECVINS